MTKTLAKLGEGGRLVIPAEYRKALGLHTGDEVILLLEEGSVRVLTPHEAVRRAQAIVRKYISPEADLVNELIADRRREAERD
ncbi:MAG TPA: AbrB/MazE/SpoVT family DNA-binding domain-containing protein [Thermoanaerobaculia bacterium]